MAPDARFLLNMYMNNFTCMTCNDVHGVLYYRTYMTYNNVMPHRHTGSLRGGKSINMHNEYAKCTIT